MTNALSQFGVPAHLRRFSFSLPVAVSLLMTILPSAALPQNAALVSNSGEISLPMRSVQSRFFVSNANTAQDALKDTAISTAGQQVVGSVAGIAGGKLLTLPVIGGLPVQGAMAAISVFHKKTVKGFTVDYLLGLASETPVPAGPLSLHIDTAQSKLQSSGVQVSSPLLLRFQASTKDFARIVRTTHLSYKEPGGNPLSGDILGSEQVEISCRTESAGDKVILTPMQPLEPGEYGVVLPTKSVGPGVNANVMWTLAWDFRVQ